MRLLLATGLYPPEIGGPATYARLFEQELPRYGIEVLVLPFSPVRSLPPVLRHIAYAWLLSQRIGRVDLILVQDTVSTGLPVALICMLARKKYIVRVPGDYAWEQGVQRFGVKDSLDEFQKKSYGPFVWILRAIQRFVIKKAYRIIVPSHYLEKIVKGWAPSKKIDVIYNGVEVPPRASTQNRESDLIVTSGRLVPWKGFKELIQIVAGTPWRLVILGDGPQRDELERQIKKNGASNRITLLGQVSREVAREWYARATVFVLNSQYEGLSHALIEAMATGAPVLATNVGGNPEVLFGNGFDLGQVLVDSNNKVDLEKKLERLMKNPRFREQEGEFLWAKAHSFSIEACVEATAKVLKETP